jgi:hypothetical protein
VIGRAVKALKNGKCICSQFVGNVRLYGEETAKPKSERTRLLTVLIHLVWQATPHGITESVSHGCIRGRTFARRFNMRIHVESGHKEQ